MKLYEAVVSAIDEFGIHVFENPNIVNILSDFSAFEESRAFKIILKNIINEGYWSQLNYVKDWDKNSDRIINRFVESTGFQLDKSKYVFDSLAFGLDLTKTCPTYVESFPNVNGNSSGKPISNSIYKQLNKTVSQLAKMDDDDIALYKEKAQDYLDSIIELKEDFKSEYGADVAISSRYEVYVNGGDIRLNFEVSGKIKVKYNYHISFNFVIYDHKGKVLGSTLGLKSKNSKSYELITTDSISVSDFKYIGNIAKIVVYYDKL